jgi:hypothetical protein
MASVRLFFGECDRIGTRGAMKMTSKGDPPLRNVREAFARAARERRALPSRRHDSLSCRSGCPEFLRKPQLIQIFRLFGPWASLLTSFLIAPVAIAYGGEADVIDLLSTGRIKTSATWCYKKPGPERCAVNLHIKDGFLVLDGVGCGSFKVPVNGSNGRQSAKISGNALTVSVTGKDGTGVNTYELSTDLTQCSHTMQCPAGFQAKVFSCSVERNAPTQTAAHEASSARAAPKNAEQGSSPNGAQNFHTQLVDAQSYMQAARDLKEREPTYNSLWAAVQTFRRAAAAFDATGETAQAQAAADEAQMLENDIRIAGRRFGLNEDQNQCGMLRGNALQCYARATRLQSSPLSAPIPAVGPVAAFLDCVKTYCSAMQNAKCPMPLFGKDNAGFCFTIATDDHDVVQQESSTAKPQHGRNGGGTRR